MGNYASFLLNFEKDKNQLIELEKDKIETYHKYFQIENEKFLHLNISLQLDEEGGTTRNLGLYSFFVINFI